MKIKITFDKDGVYGYPNGGIISPYKLLSDYIDCLNKAEDADTIAFLKQQPIEKAVEFVAEMWGIDYEFVPLTKIRKCAICGRLITSGYLFDGTTALCDKECATSFFNDDEGCVDILIDDGDRLVWYDEFCKREHFRVNIGHSSPDCFHHFDNVQSMFRWISEKVGTEIRSFSDCEEWTRKQPDGSYIEILYFSDLNKFYKNRREYVLKVRECEDSSEKAKRKTLAEKRNYQMERFSKAYDDANWYWEIYPEVWQGEI